jgi:hypothetical protein
MRTCVSRGFERVSCAVVAAVVLFAGAQGTLAQSVAAHHEKTYSFETVDPPFGTPGVDMAVQALWMNNRGLVVAQYQTPPDTDWFTNVHGAVLQHGTWTNVDIEGAVSSAAVPNNRGQLLLTYRLQDGPWRVAIRDRRGLDLLPDLADYPGGIIGDGFNDLGQMMPPG